jgi:hypothetical protein
MPDEPVIIPHPVSPLLPGCPLAHLRAYHLSPQTYHVLERELDDEATVGDLLEHYMAGTLTKIRGVAAARAAELQCVLTSGGLVPGDLSGGASSGLRSGELSW